MNRVPYNKTKIVATIGPASSSPEVLRKLMLAGVDVCRLNLSHGDDSVHEGVINTIRNLNRELHLNTSILVDLQGPKLRIGEVENNEIFLENGSKVIFSMHECVGTSKRLYMNYQDFAKDVAIDDKVLIDDGKIVLNVSATNHVDEVVAIVESGGKLSSRKGVNLPKTKISLPSLTPKDLHDLEFALKQNVDWIGLSFVRNPLDIIDLKKRIKAAGRRCRVIAKIEKPEALVEIDHIIAETDALMVARGDLGVELPMEEVPLIQKMLVNKCIQASKPVIIATQMMESMITSYTPTRAEVNDVANSVIDGADAVMLSGETSVGLYPVRVVEHMRMIISKVESKGYRYNRSHAPDITSPTFISDSVCYNACVMASQVGGRAIVGMTRSGYTAYKVSAQRPHADILIFTDVPEMLNVLSLVWGVRGFYYDRTVSTDETIIELQDILKEKGYVNSGDIIINLASIPLEEQGRTNMIKLGRVK
jgi:pyruvate kinase